MIDRPDAERLLSAVADSLHDEVVGVLSSPDADPADLASARYVARIASNLCSILAREAVCGPAAEQATVADLERLLDIRGSLDELVVAFDQVLAADADGLDPVVVHRLLSDNVERRLAIARPDYLRPRSERAGENEATAP